MPLREGALCSRQPSVSGCWGGGGSGQPAAFSKECNLPWWIIREGSWSSLRCYIVFLREGALCSQQPSVSGCWGGGGSGQPAAFSKEW